MSSQKEIIQSINAAFTRNDIPAFLAYCTEDFQWNILGMKLMKGKQEVLDFMKGSEGEPGPEMQVDKVFATANAGASTGTMKMKNKEGELVESYFCDVYTFEGGRVTMMDSCIIDIKK